MENINKWNKGYGMSQPQASSVQINEPVIVLTKEMVEMGIKQQKIEDLKAILKLLKELSVEVIRKIYTSKLYLDASIQMFAHEKHVIFKEYEKFESDKQLEYEKNLEDIKRKIVIIESNIDQIKNKSNLEQTQSIPIHKMKEELESLSLKCREMAKPMFIKQYLEHNKLRDLDVDCHKRLEDSVKIIVIGKRGTGKSSFINSIRNIDELEEESNDVVAPTDAVECTEFCRFYQYKFDIDEATLGASVTVESVSKSASFIYLIDFPGVGTERFPSEDYTEMLLNMEPDAFVYLFQSYLEDIDYKIIQEIKSKIRNGTIFLVRSKIDADFAAWLKTVKNNSIDLDELDSRDVEKIVKNYWQEFREYMQYHFIKFTHSNKLKLDDTCYFISNQGAFSKLFDFDLLVNDIINYLPPDKSKSLKTVMRYVFGKASDTYKSIKKKFLQ